MHEEKTMVWNEGRIMGIGQLSVAFNSYRYRTVNFPRTIVLFLVLICFQLSPSQIANIYTLKNGDTQNISAITICACMGKQKLSIPDTQTQHTRTHRVQNGGDSIWRNGNGGGGGWRRRRQNVPTENAKIYFKTKAYNETTGQDTELTSVGVASLTLLPFFYHMQCSSIYTRTYVRTGWLAALLCNPATFHCLCQFYTVQSDTEQILSKKHISVSRRQEQLEKIANISVCIQCLYRIGPWVCVDAQYSNAHIIIQ